MFFKDETFLVLKRVFSPREDPIKVLLKATFASCYRLLMEKARIVKNIIAIVKATIRVKNDLI